MEGTGISGYRNHMSKTTSEKFYLVESKHSARLKPKVNSNEAKDNPLVARGVWKSLRLIFPLLYWLYLLASVAEFRLRVGKSFMCIKCFSPGFLSPHFSTAFLGMVAGLSCLSCSMVFFLLSLLEVVPTTVLLLLNYILNLYRLITESLWL